MKITIFLILISTNIYSFAANVYISDQIDIPIRSDKNFEDNILRAVSSGSKLNLIETSDDGWTKVKFETTIGWILSRYLTNNEPAKKQLNKLKKILNINKLSTTKQKNNINKLTKNVMKLTKELILNKSKQQKLITENNYIKKTYYETLELERNNYNLTKKNLNLTAKLKLLKLNNDYSIEESNRLWFLYGGILLSIGVLLGIIIVKIK